MALCEAAPRGVTLCDQQQSKLQAIVNPLAVPEKRDWMPETLLAVVGALGLLYLLTVGLAALLGHRCWARWVDVRRTLERRSPTPQDA